MSKSPLKSISQNFRAMIKLYYFYFVEIIMKQFYLTLIILALSVTGFKAQIYFPPLSGQTWDTLAPQRFGWCQPQIDSLYNYLQVKNTKSFIILKNGKIVLEKYFGSYTSDSLFYWASASKSLASFIAGIAQQKGLININNPVSQYLGTGWTSEPLQKENLITVGHLLRMTSGLEDNPPLPCDNEDTAKACLIYKVDAGNRWAYHTGAYKKVQSVVSAAAGQNYNVITNNWIKTMIGIGGLWLDQTYYSKARDMARFGLLVQNHGIWSTDTVMKDQAYFNAMTNTSQSFNPAYGYLWWLNGKSGYLNPGLQLLINGPLIPNAPADLLCALGKNDQKIYVSQGSGLVVIRQGNSAEGVTFALSSFDNNLWSYINRLNCNTTGIKNAANDIEALTIYPNPSDGYFKVVSTVKFKSFALEDVSGRSIDIAIVNDVLDASSLTSGIYFFKAILADDRILVRKVVIN